jgi:thiol-disulfide isomerase/thioredoxin
MDAHLAQEAPTVPATAFCPPRDNASMSPRSPRPAAAHAPIAPLAAPARRRFLLAAAALGAAGRARAQDGAQHIVRPWPRERVVPALRLDDLDGKRWDLAALKGRPVLLNFWATWCEPCRAEMPSLQRVARERAGDGLLVLAVNYQEGAPKIRSFLETLRLELPVLLDRDGTAARQWTPRVFPSTVLVDRRGQPMTSVVGEIDWTGAEAAALLKSLLAVAA